MDSCLHIRRDDDRLGIDTSRALMSAVSASPRKAAHSDHEERSHAKANWFERASSATDLGYLEDKEG